MSVHKITDINLYKNIQNITLLAVLCEQHEQFRSTQAVSFCVGLVGS